MEVGLEVLEVHLGQVTVALSQVEDSHLVLKVSLELDLK